MLNDDTRHVRDLAQTMGHPATTQTALPAPVTETPTR